VWWGVVGCGGGPGLAPRLGVWGRVWCGVGVASVGSGYEGSAAPSLTDEAEARKQLERPSPHFRQPQVARCNSGGEHRPRPPKHTRLCNLCHVAGKQLETQRVGHIFVAVAGVAGSGSDFSRLEQLLGHDLAGAPGRGDGNGSCHSQVEGRGRGAPRGSPRAPRPRGGGPLSLACAPGRPAARACVACVVQVTAWPSRPAH
jgi:hypothetical protein